MRLSLRHLRLLFLFCLALLALLLLATVEDAQAQSGDLIATSGVQTNLRAGPSLNQTVLGTIGKGTAVIVEARNSDTSWVLVRLKEGQGRGWGRARYFNYPAGTRLRNLPLSKETVTSLLSAPAPEVPPTLPPSITGKEELNAPFIPQITPAIRTTMRAIAARGRAMGNNPRVFSKVGDCMTDHWAFMNVIGYGNYNLGKYGYLQEVINYFSVPPRAGLHTSFDAKSLASHNGFNSSAVLESPWADPTVCQKGERPIECEYRLNKPAIAVIMFGTADVLVMTPTQYNSFLRHIVYITTQRGIVPILTTFPENPAAPERSRQINQVVLQIAKEKNIPVINLASALQPLPAKGLEPDAIHMTIPPEGRSGFFDDNNLKFGYTMRNLLTLQALDVVWKQILR